MRRDESWQGRRWLNEPKRKLKRKQMWRVIRQICRCERCEDADEANYNLCISYQSQNHHWYQCPRKTSTDSNSGSDRNVNNVTPTSFIPWHFLIASHTRVNAMLSRATIMRRACIKMLLAHICLPTQTPKSQNYNSFGCPTSISRKAVESLIWKSYFSSAFDVRRLFRAKRLKF